MKRLILAVFLFAAALGAQEKTEARENITLKWVNFSILVIGLGYLCAKSLPPFFKSRTSEIQQGIIEAQAMKKDAERRAAEMEARLGSLSAEIERFRAQCNVEMEQEAQRIRQETAHQISRIEQQGQAEIETVGKIARRALQAHAAKLALDLAEQRIRQRLDHAADSLLADDFVRDLGASRN